MKKKKFENTKFNNVSLKETISLVDVVRQAMIAAGAGEKKTDDMIAAIAAHALKGGKSSGSAFLKLIEKIDDIKFEKDNEFGVAIFRKNPERIRTELNALLGSILQK